MPRGADAHGAARAGRAVSRARVRRWSERDTGHVDDPGLLRTAHFSPSPQATAVFRILVGLSNGFRRVVRLSSGFSGAAPARLPRSAAERMFRLHRTSPNPPTSPQAAGNERRGRAVTTDGSFGQAVVKAVTAGPPLVHVHLPTHLHMNRVMIRVS
ncbi:hypothetical protein GCM10010104_69080 [Streptomyces indiaensis]|uniref:Uncharacterized protein n=1 Tax=Streptomyces indiaensis TaxID=284033 RepID=A0ABP5RL97_9ACTN